MTSAAGSLAVLATQLETGFFMIKMYGILIHHPAVGFMADRTLHIQVAMRIFVGFLYRLDKAQKRG
jgi:hypothetical protein